jgi:hypothetical protein
MTGKRNAVVSEGPRAGWLVVARIVFVVALTVFLYLLGQSMVRHHFFGGGRDYNNWRDERRP